MGTTMTQAETCLLNDTQYDPDNEPAATLETGMSLAASSTDIHEDYVTEALYDAATASPEAELYEYSDPIKPAYLVPQPIRNRHYAQEPTPPTLPTRPSIAENRPVDKEAAPEKTRFGWIHVVLGLYGILFAVVFATRPTVPPAEVLQTTEQIISTRAFGFVGQVAFFATSTLPAGWIVCDGRTLDAAAYPELAAALGANGTNVTLPDMVTDGLFPRGGLEPGEVQPYATAVDGISGTVEVWENANPSDLVAWSYDTFDPDAPRRQYVNQLRSYLTTRRIDIGLWSSIFPVNMTSNATETRPPAIVLVPAIYVRGSLTWTPPS